MYYIPGCNNLRLIMFPTEARGIRVYLTVANNASLLFIDKRIHYVSPLCMPCLSEILWQSLKIRDGKFKYILFPSKKSRIWRDRVIFSIHVTFLTSQSHELYSDVPDQSQEFLFSSFQNAGWLHDCKTKYKLYIILHVYI